MTDSNQQSITRFTGSYAFLSNFYRSPILMPGLDLTFPTAEHAYQCSKPENQAQMAWIYQAATPGEAKHRGRQVQLQPAWEQQKKRIMMEILLAKFIHPPLRDLLVSTGQAFLVEGNSWGDVYWGAVGPHEKGWDSSLPWWHNWAERQAGNVLAGENWLGRMLMMVRDVVS